MRKIIEYAVCPRCHGKGMPWWDVVWCRICGGDGKIIIKESEEDETNTID